MSTVRLSTFIVESLFYKVGGEYQQLDHILLSTAAAKKRRGQPLGIKGVGKDEPNPVLEVG